MRIAESARNHGIADDDMRHVARNVIRRIERDDLMMFIGPARDGALLEVGVLDLDTDPVIVHAMRLRPSLYRFL